MHRKSHGKASFMELSQAISARWARLDDVDPETKAYVKMLAQRELEEYTREMEEYKAAATADPFLTPTRAPATRAVLLCRGVWLARWLERGRRGSL